MRTITKNAWRSFCMAAAMTAICSCTPSTQKVDRQTEKQDDYYVAAYIWPSCHNDPMGQDTLWGEGIGEWEVIKKGNPRFEGHYQPKVPLWGYEMDDDTQVMEKWIDVATAHGINMFIFDWYWYDGQPFLESTVNNGFLKAKNNEKMKFYLMWANHHVAHNYWNVHRYKDDKSRLWNGTVDWDNFKIIVERVIRQYFHKPNYFKIDGCPVFSIFGYYEVRENFGDAKGVKKAMDYFREEVKKAGFPNLHLQLIGDGFPFPEFMEMVATVGVNSVTKYNWGWPFEEDYVSWGTKAMQRREQWTQALDSLGVPFFPNASIGWDDSPRFPNKKADEIVHYNDSPESFAAFLQKTKEYVDQRPGRPKLITINSWNEWVEGSYLLPDMKNGFGYLNAVKQVMNGEYENFGNKN